MVIAAIGPLGPGRADDTADIGGDQLCSWEMPGPGGRAPLFAMPPMADRARTFEANGAFDRPDRTLSRVPDGNGILLAQVPFAINRRVAIVS
jgi:hypothetical protein